MKEGKVLGLDYGKKRIGVATGDLEMRISFPREVIENKGMDFVLNKISDFISEYGISLIIVGMPLKHAHQKGANIILDDVRYFADQIKKKLDIEVKLLDERYSSFEADELMRDIESKGGEKKGRDAYAAQVILQRFFDKINE